MIEHIEWLYTSQDAASLLCHKILLNTFFYYIVYYGWDLLVTYITHFCCKAQGSRRHCNVLQFTITMSCCCFRFHVNLLLFNDFWLILELLCSSTAMGRGLFLYTQFYLYQNTEKSKVSMDIKLFDRRFTKLNCTNALIRQYMIS